MKCILTFTGSYFQVSDSLRNTHLAAGQHHLGSTAAVQQDSYQLRILTQAVAFSPIQLIHVINPHTYLLHETESFLRS